MRRSPLEDLRDQAGRFRTSLETMMCSGEPIAGDERARLSRIPAVRFLLSNLIGQDSAGQRGRIEAAEARLVDGAESHAIEGSITIAHLHDLSEAGQLAYW